MESAGNNFTGAGVIICTKDGYVLTLKKDHGIWGLPGGKPVGDETPKETAIRETEEETGIVPKNLKGPIITENKNKIYYSYISIIDKKIDVILSKEHKKFSWVYYKDLPKINLFSLFRKNIKKIIKEIERELN
jgi:8-oxo-dGTP pyrophosphatase MutT (NUDIX family)